MIKVFLKVFCYASFFLLNLKAASQDIVINEIMSSNDTVIMDFNSNYSDWIELHNKTDEGINLLDYGLSDDKEDHYKWKFPAVEIPANGFLMIYASGYDTITETEIHTNFSIQQAGEPIILTSNLGVVLSQIEGVAIPTDQSYACLFDGSDFMTISNQSTPNTSNNGFAGIYSSYRSGFYDAEFELELITSDPATTIYYTLNGETPSTSSTEYTEPIRIKNNQSDPLNIGLIPTTPLEGEYQLYDFIWKTPEEVYRCNTVRYATFKDDEMHGFVRTKNFFIDKEIANRYSFPIVSIVTDSFNLFDYETGIYIPGKRFDENGFNFWPEGNYHNKGREWEREMHITYFEPNGALAFETNAGMRMRGYGSASNPQKSFNTYFRNEYGLSGIEYPVFRNNKTTRYKRLIFRNSGNDFIYSHFKDALLQDIIAPLNLELQAFQPSVVFLNGEYWGIHNIREKYDEYYFEYRLGVENEDVNILGICGDIEEGDNAEYLDLLDYINGNDLSVAAHYNYVASKLDIDNFIDFQIAEIYFANYDWPCNNFKIWKENKPESKWRFLIYDLDLSFGYSELSDYTTNSLEHATKVGDGWPNCPCSNLVFRSLLTSDAFKTKFLNRFVYCLENTFDANIVNEKIDEFERMFLPEIEEHIKRWGYPATISDWKDEVQKLRDFATYRPCYMSENIISYFELEEYDFTCFETKDTEEPVIILFPNPTDGNFNIINNFNPDLEPGNVIVRNSLGQVVYLQEDVEIALKRRVAFNLNYLEDGVYFFTFKNEEVSETKKVVVTSTVGE